ncbi:MAG: hypothetical protein JWO98_2058 [Frankiales bacterium]|nr:hypothetical protein [Frankiales bacterium]
MAEPGLFPEPTRTAPDPTEGTTGERRRARQAAAIALGQHPLSVALGTPLPLHPAASDGAEGGPTCGTCDLRERRGGGVKSYPKCLAGATVRRRRPQPSDPASRRVDADGLIVWTEYPRATHGAGTDVAAWWPACHDYYRAGEPEEGQ